MKVTKEQFCSIINRYKEMSREEEAIVNALNGNYEWKPSEWINSYYELIDLLCEFDEKDYDTYSGSWLDYFCFELDFGSKWEPGTIEEDGVDIPLATAEDLWNIITKE